MNSTTIDIQDALRQLDLEHGIYAALLDLARRQAEILEGDAGVEALLSVIVRKQALMDELGVITSELSSVRRNWSTVREIVPPGDREAFEGRVREVRRVLEEVIAMEDRGRESLAGRRTARVDATAPARAERAYRAAAEAESSSAIDRRG